MKMKPNPKMQSNGFGIEKQVESGKDDKKLLEQVGQKVTCITYGETINKTAVWGNLENRKST